VGSAPNRGRVYFSGIGESNSQDGVFSNTVMADLKALVQTWADGFTISGTNTKLQILRRPSAKFPTYVAHPVEFVKRTDVTRSQRRRNLGSA